MSLALAPPPQHPQRVPPDGLPCRNFDPDLWFSELPGELDQAKSLCTQCPLRQDCLAGALEREEPWGVWGGEIFERGTIVPRKRPRGRPRKEDLAKDAELHAEALARAAAVAGTTAEAQYSMRLAA